MLHSKPWQLIHSDCSSQWFQASLNANYSKRYNLWSRIYSHADLQTLLLWILLFHSVKNCLWESLPFEDGTTATSVLVSAISSLNLGQTVSFEDWGSIFESDSSTVLTASFNFLSLLSSLTFDLCWKEDLDPWRLTLLSVCATGVSISFSKAKDWMKFAQIWVRRNVLLKGKCLFSKLTS